MSKVKSVKFYNFTEINGSYATLISVRFYDINGKLILIDFSNLISLNDTYCENSEYIVTSYSSHSSNGAYPYQSFHTGNKNNNLNLSHLGTTWAPAALHATSNEFLKIKFKFPQYISKIEILHSYSEYYALDTMDYDIEFNDGIIKAYHFKSNGKFSPISHTTMENFQWDQEKLDSVFSELKFDKSKQIYDLNIGLVETLDINNFRSISVNTVEKLKSLCVKPKDTFLSCLISFDKKQTWKAFDGTNWNTISNISPENIILNGMEVDNLNKLDKNKLIAGGFTGDLDFKIAMKTNDTSKTPSVTKIYIEYK